MSLDLIIGLVGITILSRLASMSRINRYNSLAVVRVVLGDLVGAAQVRRRLVYLSSSGLT